MRSENDVPVVHTAAAELTPSNIPGDIHQLICDQIYRYAFYCDTQQYHALPRLVSEDDVFDETCLGFPMIRGQAELRKVFNVPPDKYVYFIHYISNVLVKHYDGQTAGTIAYLRGEGLLKSGAQPKILGYYDDIFVKQDETWLVQSRRLVAFTQPTGFSITT